MDDLNVLEELLSLPRRKAEYQPSESRQKNILFVLSLIHI